MHYGAGTMQVFVQNLTDSTPSMLRVQMSWESLLSRV